MARCMHAGGTECLRTRASLKRAPGTRGKLGNPLVFGTRETSAVRHACVHTGQRAVAGAVAHPQDDDEAGLWGDRLDARRGRRGEQVLRAGVHEHVGLACERAAADLHREAGEVLLAGTCGPLVEEVDLLAPRVVATPAQRNRSQWSSA